MNRRLLTTVLAIFFLFGLVACGGYYKVVDPASGNVYYTTKVKSEPGGAVKLKDAKTGAEVTIQNSEVTKVKKDEFKANTEEEEETK